MKEVAGDQVIDRDDEWEVLRALLEAGESRVLFVTEDANRGKSALLRKLVHLCDFEASVPTALVELRDVDGSHPYELVKVLAGTLRAQLRLQRYEALLRTGATGGSAAFDGSQISGGQQAGTITNVEARQGATTQIFQTGLDPLSQDLYRTKAVDAFLEDLAEACAERPVVLFFDSFDDRASKELRDWLLRILVRARLLDAAEPPPHLFVVVAGRPDAIPLGSFQKKYGPRVETIDRMPWDPDDLRAFLALNGYPEVDQGEVDWLVSGMETLGYNLERAIQIIQLARGA